MKILLVGNYLPDRQQSMQRFTDVLSSALSKAGCEVSVIRPEPLLGRLKAGDHGLGKWFGYFDKFIWFPFQLKKAALRADLVHITDHSNAGYSAYLHATPHLVTCHDLLAIRSALGEIPENPTRWTGRQFQRLILNGLNKSQRIVCVSEKTREDLLRISRVIPSVASVIYMGLNYPYTPMTSEASSRLLAALSLAPGYILHVGLNAWYKNRIGVLQIYRALIQKDPLAPKLVMAGAAFTPEMVEFVQSHGLQDKVCEVLACSNEELRGLYSAAELLLFPSLEEGFGWPIIEAQACGCRVVTTARPPMTEVGGTSAFYIDPRKIESAADTVFAALSESPAARSARAGAGFFNVRRFSTERMIEDYLRHYQLSLEECSLAGQARSRPTTSSVN